jgi:hypothetical protein
MGAFADRLYQAPSHITVQCTYAVNGIVRGSASLMIIDILYILRRSGTYGTLGSSTRCICFDVC